MRINQSRETGFTREIDHLRRARHRGRNRCDLVSFNYKEHILSRLLRFAINQSSAMNEKGRWLNSRAALTERNLQQRENRKKNYKNLRHSVSSKIPRRNNKP